MPLQTAPHILTTVGPKASTELILSLIDNPKRIPWGWTHSDEVIEDQLDKLFKRTDQFAKYANRASQEEAQAILKKNTIICITAYYETSASKISETYRPILKLLTKIAVVNDKYLDNIQTIISQIFTPGKALVILSKDIDFLEASLGSYYSRTYEHHRDNFADAVRKDDALKNLSHDIAELFQNDNYKFERIAMAKYLDDTESNLTNILQAAPSLEKAIKSYLNKNYPKNNFVIDVVIELLTTFTVHFMCQPFNTKQIIL